MLQLGNVTERFFIDPKIGSFVKPGNEQGFKKGIDAVSRLVDSQIPMEMGRKIKIGVENVSGQEYLLMRFIDKFGARSDELVSPQRFFWEVSDEGMTDLMKNNGVTPYVYRDANGQAKRGVSPIVRFIIEAGKKIRGGNY